MSRLPDDRVGVPANRRAIAAVIATRSSSSLIVRLRRSGALMPLDDLAEGCDALAVAFLQWLSVPERPAWFAARPARTRAAPAVTLCSWSLTNLAGSCTILPPSDGLRRVRAAMVACL